MSGDTNGKSKVIWALIGFIQTIFLGWAIWVGANVNTINTNVAEIRTSNRSMDERVAKLERYRDEWINRSLGERRNR